MKKYNTKSSSEIINFLLPFFAFCISLSFVFLSNYSFAQSSERPITPGTPSEIPLRIKEIGRDFYLITGRGANVIVRRTPNKVILIDNKVMYESVFNELTSLIRTRVSDNPISLAFVLHHHADHSGNNARVLATGADLVGQVNMVETLRTYKSRIAPVNPAAPNITFTDKYERTEDGVRIIVYYWGPAHTNSDIVVYFPDDKIVVAGDILHADGEPSIDALEGKGNIFGLLEQLDNILKLDFTIAVPGHGDNVLTKPEVALYRNRIHQLIVRGQNAVRCGVNQSGLRAAMRSDDLGFRLVGHLWANPEYVAPIYEQLKQSVTRNGKMLSRPRNCIN